MRKYTAELLDQSGSPVVFLENANQIALQGFRLNQANSPAFIFPLNDDKASLLSMARRFKIYRNGEELYSGKINDRKADKAKGIMTIKGITQESELSRMITPDNWVYPPDSRLDTNEKDLADAVKYFLKDWEIYRKNASEDFAGYVEASDVDTTTDPGIIFLSTNQKTTTKKVGDPPTDTTFNYDQFVSNGYITFEFNLSSEVTEVERIRWKQVVGEAKDEGDNVQGTYITFQYCYSTNGGNTWTTWSTEAGKNAVSDYPENEGFPISITGLSPVNDNRLRVKMMLYTENTTAEAYDWEDLDPAIKNTLGITPELHGIEIICRKDGTVSNGNILASTGIKVESFEISRDNHLNIIRQLCEEYDHEFMVKDDLTLDLSQEFGTFHADPFISGENCIITNLSDTLKIKNVIHCYGAGEGPDQRYTVVKDQASIDQYGEYPVIFEDTSIDNIDELEKAGQKELQGQPQQRFDIDIPYDSNTPFVALGDTITVLIPKENIEITGRVVEWSGGESGNGEIIKVSLDTPQSNIIDHIIKPKRLKKKISGIQPPSQVRAKGGYGYAQVTWSGNADYYLVQTTQEPGDEHSWRNVGGKILEKKYSLTQTPTDTKIYFRVAGVKDGQMSLWSQVVSAKTTQLPPEDIYRPDSSKPILQKATSTIIQVAGGPPVISVELSWNPPIASEKITDVDIERKLLPDGPINTFPCPNELGPCYDTGGLQPGKGYEYRVRFVNEWGKKSEWSNAEPVTTASDNEAPAKPTGVIASPHVGFIAVRCTANSEPDLAGYEWKWSEGTDPEKASILDGSSNANMYKGQYGDTVNFWVRAYDDTGNYSPYSDMITATAGKIAEKDIIFFDAKGIMSPLVIADAIKAGEINIADNYSLDINGIKDRNGYVVIDPNGFNGRTIIEGFLDTKSLDMVPVVNNVQKTADGKIIVPAGKRWIGIVDFVDYGTVAGSDQSKQLKYIGSIDITGMISFVKGIGREEYYSTGGALESGEYEDLYLRIDHASHANYGYTDGTNKYITTPLKCYYKVIEVNV